MNKKAILITAAAVLVLGTVFALLLSGVWKITPPTAAEKEFGRKKITAEMVFEGFEGVVTLELYPDVAPKTVKNFVNLVDDGFYNGLTIHRIVSDFIIQGGSPTGDGSGGSDKRIKGEFSANGVNNTIRHRRGVISMARVEGDYNSATSQFFILICPEDTPASYLDGQYAAFGRVVDGLDVVEAVASVPCVGDSPIEAPVIKEIKILK